jgi:hypothetical protein
MAEMERAYDSAPLGGEPHFSSIWWAYEDDGDDVIDCAAGRRGHLVSTWAEERSQTDTAVAGWPVLAAATHSGRSLRWNLQKLVGEYARHNGRADLLRERIDGRTGA